MSSDSECDSWTSYDVPFRCRLCRFQFEPGATFVADVGSKRSEPCRFSYIYCVNRDETSGVRIRMCWDGDDRPGSYTFTAAFHEECLDVWGPRLPPSSMHDATAYTFAPSWPDSLYRQNRTRYFLQNRLTKLFPKLFLPPEVWSIVANDDIVRMCAVHAVRELWKRRRSCSAELDLSQGIWAHYIYVDGVRYVERLTRAPGATTCDDKSSAIKLLDSSSASKKTVVYVLEDHLGVRQIVFAAPDDNLSALTAGSAMKRPGDYRNNNWWRTVQLQPGSRLRALSDGLKIRYIKAVTQGEDHTYQVKGTIWRAPTPPSKMPTIIRYTPRLYDEQEWGSWYMASIACNAPGTTGYSAFWSRNLIALHAHRQGEDMSFYRHYDRLHELGLWIYFPLMKGESVVDVFSRRGDEDHHMGLIFRTSKGRDMVLGPGLPLPRQGSTNYSLWYQHICSLPANTPTRIHYNISPHGIRRLAFEQAGPRNQPPIRPRWLYNPTFSGWYFASTIRLDGVVTITPSYKPHSYIDGVMMCGLLFEYAKGRPCASFGEFRLDNVGEPIDVSIVEALYLGCFFDGRVPAHLTQVSTTSRVNERTLKWLRIPLQGCIELWYSGFHSYIFTPQV